MQLCRICGIYGPERGIVEPQAAYVETGHESRKERWQDTAFAGHRSHYFVTGAEVVGKHLQGCLLKAKHAVKQRVFLVNFAADKQQLLPRFMLPEHDKPGDKQQGDDDKQQRNAGLCFHGQCSLDSHYTRKQLQKKMYIFY